MNDVDAHALASEIEWIHAKGRAAIRNARSGSERYTAENEYDPLAATCLGDRILSVARSRPALATNRAAGMTPLAQLWGR